jgi:hypothetical protein
MTNDDRCRRHARSARNRRSMSIGRPETGRERKGRMMRLYMRQSLRSTDGTNNRYGNR